MSRIISEGLGGRVLVTGGYGPSGGGAAYAQTLTTAQGTLASLASLKVRLVALAVAQPSGAGLARLTAKALAAQQATVPSLGKALTKALAAATAAAATVSAVGPGVTAALGTVFRSPPRLVTLTSVLNRLFRSPGR